MSGHRNRVLGWLGSANRQERSFSPVSPSTDNLTRTAALPSEQYNSEIDCVFLTCFDSNFHVFASLLRSAGIRMHRADTIEQADFFLTVTEATVLLSDTIYLDGTWDQAAEMLAYLHSGAAFLLVVDEAENRFWQDSIKQRGCDLVWKPLLLGELRRAIKAADSTAQKNALQRFAGVGA